MLQNEYWVFGCKNRLRYRRERALQSLMISLMIWLENRGKLRYRTLQLSRAGMNIQKWMRLNLLSSSISVIAAPLRFSDLAESLPRHAHFPAFFKIDKIHTPLHRSKFQNLPNSRQSLWERLLSRSLLLRSFIFCVRPKHTPPWFSACDLNIRPPDFLRAT